MNLPNKLTLSRILLTILFIVLLFSKGVTMQCAALLVFLLAALTDYWDGRIARARGQITPFGRLMDPIADKFLTLSAFISFVQMGIVPAWMVIVVISRDVLITGLRLSAPEEKSKKIEARQSGKHKTVFQMIAIVAVLIFLILKETVFWQAEWTAGALKLIYYGMFFIVAVTVWSGVRYLLKNKGHFG